MRKKRRGRFDRDLVTELQLGRIGPAGEPLQPSPDAGCELGRITEPRGFARVARRDRNQRSSSRCIEVDDDHRALGLALLRIREDLARPHREPAVGQLDLPHRHCTGIGQIQQQRVRIGRVARDAHRVGHQLVGHRADRAFQDLGEAIIRVQFLPYIGRWHTPRQAVDQDQLLADPQTTLQDFGFDALQLRIALEQRLQTRRILVPECLPEREPLLGGVVFAIGRRMRLASVAAGKLGMQVGNRLTEHLGDARTFSRREVGLCHPLQLIANRVVMLGDVRQRQRPQPACATVSVGERQRRRLGAGLRERELVGHRFSVRRGSRRAPGSRASREPCLGFPALL